MFCPNLEYETDFGVQAILGFRPCRLAASLRLPCSTSSRIDIHVPCLSNRCEVVCHQVPLKQCVIRCQWSAYNTPSGILPRTSGTVWDRRFSSVTFTICFGSSVAAFCDSIIFFLLIATSYAVFNCPGSKLGQWTAIGTVIDYQAKSHYSWRPLRKNVVQFLTMVFFLFHGHLKRNLCWETKDILFLEEFWEKKIQWQEGNKYRAWIHTHHYPCDCSRVFPNQ